MGLSAFKDNKIYDDDLEPKLSEVREARRQKELEERVISVCEYIIETESSFRKTAEKFNLTAPTINDYCKRFKDLSPLRYPELKKVIDKNTEPTIKDENVKKRVLENAKLIVSGKTIEEISADTGIDYWVVYRDIKNRLKNVDSELYEEVSQVLQSRKNANLNRGGKK